MTECIGYAAKSASSLLGPFRFERRDAGDKDVRIEIAFCGICHSDLHMARNEWTNTPTTYPLVPGHEIAGRVIAVGKRVRKFKVGDLAGVGCLVDSCRRCENCRKKLDQFCRLSPTFTYNSVGKDGKPTYGGYSSHIVVDEDFALKIAPGLPLDRVAPLLCAGITTYSPLKRFGAGKGSRVGVLGLGGLGHMAVKIAAAMGAEVTVLSGSKSKAADAKRLGAHEFALTTDEPACQRLAGRFDLIVDTVSAKHGLDFFLGMLGIDGTLALVGVSPKPLEFSAFSIIGGRRRLAGSLIGGLAETQEMLDFCAKKKILADVETIGVRDINAAYERLIKGDVRFRFSIDLKTLRS
jgi:uncharacterized zinc-type alcohol dehydrogenase-like protein